MQESSEILLQNSLIVVCWRFAPCRVRWFRATGEPFPIQWIAAEPLIVYTASGSSLTLPPLYFDLYFMRTVKAHQVQQESTSDKSHLLLVNSSVQQTDAISLLTHLYDPHMTIAGQVWKIIFHCARWYGHGLIHNLLPHTANFLVRVSWNMIWHLPNLPFAGYGMAKFWNYKQRGNCVM